MWYVIQVRVGSEENIKLQCHRNIEKHIMERCFVPYYEEKKKIQGKWRIEKKRLFPGYIFVVTEDIEELFRQLKKVIGLTKLIGVGDDIVALTDKEEAFLEQFGDKEQIVRMSEGIIENSEIIVTSGPLKGLEGYIRKIDRHKRKAWLELPLFGGMQRVEVGLEIIVKK